MGKMLPTGTSGGRPEQITPAYTPSVASATDAVTTPGSPLIKPVENPRAGAIPVVSEVAIVHRTIPGDDLSPTSRQSSNTQGDLSTRERLRREGKEVPQGDIYASTAQASRSDGASPRVVSVNAHDTVVRRGAVETTYEDVSPNGHVQTTPAPVATRVVHEPTNGSAATSIQTVGRPAPDTEKPGKISLPNGLEGTPDELARGPQAGAAVKSAIATIINSPDLHDERAATVRTELVRRAQMITIGLSLPPGDDRARAEAMAAAIIAEAGRRNELTEANGSKPSITDNERTTSNGRRPDTSVDHAGYPPDVVAKLNSIITEYAGFTDEEIKHHCNEIRDKIEDIVGLETEFGTFRLDRETSPTDPIGGGVLFYPHVWSIDHNGRRVDLSGRQFNEYLDPKNRVKPTDVVIDVNHPSWERYQPIHED